MDTLPLFPDAPAPVMVSTPRRYAIPIYTVALVREETLHTTTRPQFRTSGAVSTVLREYLDGVDREHFVVVLLDAKNKIIGLHTVSIGTLTSSLVHPREVFKPAILSNAAAIILAHNHPSGDPTPSQEDRNITRRLREVGEVMGIRVLDHIIIGGEGTSLYCSFVDDGYWERT